MSVQTAEKQDKIVNGVNVTALADTIKAVRENPGLAEFKFRAKNKWVNGGHNQITIEEFYGRYEDTPHRKPFVLDADEPDVLLGEDKGANPVEYVLTALSSCMTTTLVYYAAASGYTLEEVESHYEGDIDLQGFLGISDDARKGYKNIRVTFKVKGDIPQDKIDEFVRQSPVFDVVTNPVPVSVSVGKQ